MAYMPEAPGSQNEAFFEEPAFSAMCLFLVPAVGRYLHANWIMICLAF